MAVLGQHKWGMPHSPWGHAGTQADQGFDFPTSGLQICLDHLHSSHEWRCEEMKAHERFSWAKTGNGPHHFCSIPFGWNSVIWPQLTVKDWEKVTSTKEEEKQILLSHQNFLPEFTRPFYDQQTITHKRSKNNTWSY